MFKFIVVVFLTSCSFFITKIDSDIVNKKSYLKNIPETSTFCPMSIKPKLQLINGNAQAQGLFQEFNEKNQEFDFLDRLALWTLIQLSVRPDQSAPSSRFQILLQMNGVVQYLDFFSESPENQYPLLYGIDWILHHFNKKKTLEDYATILDSKMPPRFKVEKELENFLITHKEKIKDHPVLGPFFIRGTDVLKENERIPKISFLKVIQFYRGQSTKQKVIVNNSLSTFSTESGQTGKCNYDFNLYNNSIFLIDQALPVSNLFGLAEGKNAFMASTSQKISKIETLNGFPLFLGESKVRSSAVCVIENKQHTIWTFSNSSRDPGQHLFHLIRYGIARSESVEEVDKLIRHSRHLFLSDPVRLIIESNRSRPDQIENLLKLNLPIYNGEKLGNIWAYTYFNSTGRFIIDDRNLGSFSCK